MTTDRWQRIEELYHSARKQEGSQRAAFLKEACAGDDALRREVESLLAQEKGLGGFLEAPALAEAAKLLVEDRGQSRVGRQLGSYQILSFLDAGGMGEVYQAFVPEIADGKPPEFCIYKRGESVEGLRVTVCHSPKSRVTSWVADMENTLSLDRRLPPSSGAILPRFVNRQYVYVSFSRCIPQKKLISVIDFDQFSRMCS